MKSPVVYDFSLDVVGIAPKFNGSADPSAWVVIAACYQPDNQGQPSLGVIPTSVSNSNLIKQAKAGKFQHLLEKCTPAK